MNSRSPDSAYSWFRLAVSLVIATVGGIGLWAAVIVLPSLQEEFGVDRAGASLPYAATNLGFAFGSIAMGRLADRFGIMKPLMGGTVVMSAGFVAAAFAPNYWTFLAAQAVLIGMLGCSPTFGPLVADVSQWFHRRRGIAIAIAASGNYLTAAIWPPLLHQLVVAIGWRNAYLVVAGICLATMLPLSLLLKQRPVLDDRPSPASSRAGTGQPLKAPSYLQVLLVFAGLSCCIAMAMPQVHIIAYCGDLGYGPARGAEMLAVMLACGVVSRIASGAIADRIGGAATMLLGSTFQCLALFAYLPFDGLVSLYLVSAIFGLSQGGIVPSYALIIRDYFPARGAGIRISMVITATVLGMAIGGWMSGKIFDLTGSYQAAFLNGIAFNLVNMGIAVWLLLLSRRQRPQTENRAIPASAG